MLAAQFTGKEYLDLNEIPTPECPEDGLLVKIAACAICGTDLKIMSRQNVKIKGSEKTQMELPRIIGHELSGTVVERGKKARGFSVGDPVVIAVTVPCLDCESCHRGHYEVCDNVKIISYDCDGGFAEYIAVDERTIKSGCVIKIKSVQNLEIASLTEPLSCAVNCFCLTPVKKDDAVVVIGTGPLSCFLLELARIYGARITVMVGRSPDKQNAATLCGTDYYFDANCVDLEREIRKVTVCHGADIVVTACSSPVAQKQALEIVAKRGAINLFGGLPRDKSVIEIDTNLIHYKECMVVGTSNSAPRHVKEALELIETGRIDMKKYISHRFKLRDVNKGLDVARKGSRQKIIITP